MTLLMWVHLLAGIIAIASGTAAIAGRKGGVLHARAGIWFGSSMVVLGVTATMLGQQRGSAGLRLGSIFTLYFILTSWVTARRRGGTSGKFEIFACLVALCAAAVMFWSAASATVPPTPVGTGLVYALASVCLIAGLLDLNVVLRTTLSPAQRITRHLWRMWFALFIAAGSFLTGQPDVIPAAVRGPHLLVLGLAPLAVLLFWVVKPRLPSNSKIITEGTA